MFSRLRRRATYANVTATFALVFAMTGGAYAANKYLITSTKQIKPSVLASLKGKAGPAGAQGPQGPQGAKGETGAAGKDGTNGSNGEKGAQGEKGPAGPIGPTGATGKEGKIGPTGPEGKTGAGTLGNGKSESGTWALTTPSVKYFGDTELGYVGYAAITFPIPLTEEERQKLTVHFIAKAEKSTECPEVGEGGTPEAKPGNLCIYSLRTFPENLEYEFVESTKVGPNSTGFLLPLYNPTAPEGYAAGTWALTAASE